MTDAGWYDDPLGAAEVRWFDGEAWTEHVSTGGRAWTARLDAAPEGPTADAVADDAESAADAPPEAPGRPPRDLLTVGALSVARPAQPRGHGSWLDVYDDAGALGRFAESEPDELAGSAVVRLLDTAGAPLLSITHPGGSNRARVEGPNGPLGFVSKVGRVRANLELHGPGRKPEGDPLVVLKPLPDKGGWSGAGVELRVWLLGAPRAGAYAEARYQLTIDGSVPAGWRRLLHALPVLVDRTLTQLVDT